MVGRGALWSEEEIKAMADYLAANYGRKAPMRELVARYLSHSISRRTFLKGLTTSGLSLAAARSVLDSLVPAAHAQAAGEAVKVVEGPGALCFAEQLIACGVKYVFGNSASEDAQFYEALVDRPQLRYILTPHEGPGAAMAAGYVKASGEPTIVMQAAVVGLVNAMGQMFNAFKEQTPLVFYSYRTDQTGRAGRDGFEEVANQESLVAPLTKYAWLARRADMIPETVRRAFKAAWTPPYGPTYASWHSDLNDERVRTEVIAQRQFDPRMRVRPNPAEVERAAKLLVEARMPLMIVGDEVYNTKAVAKAARLAELLGMPVTQARQMFVNFPEAHPLWIGNLPAARLASLDFPKNADVVINVGNKMQHNSPTPIVGRGAKFIDMRIDSWSMGNVMATEVPLVADVGYGLDDLIAALEPLAGGSFKQKASARADEVRRFSEKARTLRAMVTKNPDWDRVPMIADRVTWEVAQFADPDAIIVHEAGSVSLHSFNFDPNGGPRALLLLRRASGLGRRHRRGRQARAPEPAGDLPGGRRLVRVRADGAVEHGAPRAAGDHRRVQQPRLQRPAQPGDREGARRPHGADRALLPRLSRQPRHGHGVHRQGIRRRGRVRGIARATRAALERARKATVEGRPYLIDAQVARMGVAWAEKPWTPPIRIAQERTRKV